MTKAKCGNVKNPEKCRRKDKMLSYMDWSDWYESQIEKGEVQIKCPVCDKWVF